MGRFHIYFPAEHLELLNRERKQLGLSRSSFLRMLLLKAHPEEAQKME